MDGKKYYWLKLPKDFFKRHDITYIKSLPDGHKIALFYLELMAESVDHDGELRFSESIPYTNSMLASVTNTAADVVETSMGILEDLGLVEVKEDGTIVMPKVLKMIGFASDTDEARRSRLYRERKKAERDETSRKNVTGDTDTVTKRHESKSKSIELEKEIDKREILKRKNEPLCTFGEFQNVLMTQSEIDSLTSQYGAEQVNIVLEELSGYIVQHPRKYKDHFLTLRNWLLRRRSEINNKPIKANNRPNPYDVDDILNQAAAIEEREKGGNR